MDNYRDASYIVAENVLDAFGTNMISYSLPIYYNFNFMIYRYMLRH
jgi:hypothetical protein